jgi:hypothetical protein
MIIRFDRKSSATAEDAQAEPFADMTPFSVLENAHCSAQRESVRAEPVRNDEQQIYFANAQIGFTRSKRKVRTKKSIERSRDDCPQSDLRSTSRNSTRNR